MGLDFAGDLFRHACHKCGNDCSIFYEGKDISSWIRHVHCETCDEIHPDPEGCIVIEEERCGSILVVKGSDIIGYCNDWDYCVFHDGVLMDSIDEDWQKHIFIVEEW